MRSALVQGLCAALAADCAQPSLIESPAAAPAFRPTAGGHLLVRDDLWARLATTPAGTSDVRAEIEGIGRLEFAPDAAYAVRVPFPAYVETVHTTAGARVHPGDALATLRSGEIARLRSEIRRLGATIEAQRDAVDRYEHLVREGAASPRELIEANAALAGAEAELRGVRESLRAVRADRSGADRFVLRASAGGQVLLRHVDPGERVGPDDAEPAFLIGDAGRLVAMGAFPEQDAALLREGAECSFTLPALGAAKFDGALVQVVQTLDRATRTATAVCVPTTPDARLRAEMAARVRVVVRGDGAVVLPRRAVLLRRDAFVVFVAVGERALERRAVTLGGGLGELVHVLSGVAAGEEVVTDNAVLLDGELDLQL